MKVNAHFWNRVWFLTNVKVAHDHNTIRPHKFRLLRSYKYRNEYSQMMLYLNDIVSIHAIVIDAKGFKNLDFQERYCRNFINKFIDKVRHLTLDKGDEVNDYFDK